MKFLFRFFNEPDIVLSLECCYLEENYKEKTNEIIKLRERFSVVKFASFLIFVDGAKKKDNGC